MSEFYLVSGFPAITKAFWPLEEHKVKDPRASLSNLYAMVEQGLVHVGDRRQTSVEPDEKEPSSDCDSQENSQTLSALDGTCSTSEYFRL